MESTSSSKNTKEEQIKNVSIEGLPHDKLIAKYRSLLSIAQKAKQAKDDALSKNVGLQEENVNLSKKLSGMENQLKTSQEILAVLTEKKLNLTMELDDMKRGKSRNLDEIKSLNSKCENLEIEAESYKRQYNKLLNENELLLKQLESTEQKLQADNNKALHMQLDIKKLHENNEHIKYLWSNVSKEKLELEELLHNANNKLQHLEKQKNHWYSYLSNKFGPHGSIEEDDVESWINFLEKSYSDALLNERKEEEDNNSHLNIEMNNMRVSLNNMLLDKEAIESELNELKEQNKKLTSELDVVNMERDKMVHNLESVRVETHQLIEYSDKISHEIEVLKLEKREMEHEISSVIQKANFTNQELNGKLEQSNLELENFKIKNDSLNYELKTCKEELLNLNIKMSENNNGKLMEEIDNIKDSCINHLNEIEMLQSQNSALIQEVDEYKIKFSKVNEGLEEINYIKDENIKLKEKLQLFTNQCTKLAGDEIDPLTNCKNVSANKSQHTESGTEFGLKCSNNKLSEKNVTNIKEQHCLDGSLDKINLTEKLQECESSLQKKITENEHLNDVLQATKEKLSSLFVVEEKICSQNQCTDLSDVMNCLQQEIHVSQSIQEKYRLQVEQLQKEIEIIKLNYSADIDSYKNKALEFEDTKKQLLVNLEEKESILSKKVHETEQLTFQIKEQEHINMSLNNELIVLRNRINDVTNTLEISKANEKEMLARMEKNSQDKENLNMTLNNELIALKNKTDAIIKSLGISKVREKEMLETIERNNKALLDKELTIGMLNENLNRSNKSLESYKECVSDLEKREEEIKLEVKTLMNKIQELERFREENANKNEILSAKIDELNEDLDKKKGLINSLEKTINEFELLNRDLLQNVRKLECLNSDLNKELEDTLQKGSLSATESQQAYSLLSDELKICQTTMQTRNNEFEESNRLWNARLTVFKGGLIGLKQTNEELNRHICEIQNHVRIHFPETIRKIIESVTNFFETTIVSNKHELLAEMQHMNQALKERGELISKLQENICENKGKIKKLSDENLELQKEINQVKETLLLKEDLIKNKDLLIKELETEVNKIKEVHEASTVSEGDVMSTSTISRTEEVSRLKDIEESFEEKYVKLKFLAMKLKKRLSESTHTLEVERVKMASERQDFQDKIHSLSTVAKTAQKVQESFDKILDEQEEEKKKNEVLQNSLESVQKSEENLKLKLLNLETDVKKLPVLRKQIEFLELSLKDSKKEIKSLQKDKIDDDMKYDELKKETSILENKLTEMNQALQQALQQKRVNNVLELEMQNYEKTIADLSSQLSSEKELTKSLSDEIENMKNLINGLDEQIKLLEGRITVEEERNLYINGELSTSRLKNESIQEELDKQILNIDILSKELQCEKNKCETLVLECSTIGAEFKKKEEDLHLQLDVLQRHVHNLETTLASTKQDLIASRNEVEHIKNDFENYRIRAQSVLAKQKGETITQGEKEAREQMDLMNIEVSMLRQKLDCSLSELDTLKSESSLYLSEKERTDKRLEELSKTVQQKTQEIDSLNAEFRSHKISHETLIQCYKTELDEKETKHKTELENLQKKIDELHFKYQQKEAIPMEKDTINRKAEEHFTPVSPVNESDNLPLEREDGEGSESVPSPKTRRRSILVPLDILLSSPVDDESRGSVLMERIEKLQNELVSYEVRTRHLSSLLSEAEKDSARNAQLNSVLKEEVRRLERSLERQPHAQNTEYLKNIIIKFLTLQSCDERTRLVPVLDTILKLSPEEKQQLKIAAKVDSASWGNYLTYWSGQ